MDISFFLCYNLVMVLFDGQLWVFGEDIRMWCYDGGGEFLWVNFCKGDILLGMGMRSCYDGVEDFYWCGQLLGIDSSILEIWVCGGVIVCGLV